jgi:hypothetical protein
VRAVVKNDNGDDSVQEVVLTTFERKTIDDESWKSIGEEL